ncbi:hypothetical protein GF336_04135 [Candidatus Woesearchaeota archaeon]|nr:hypothetical protein [Candidatus Woesearchaeota archaeon]
MKQMDYAVELASLAYGSGCFDYIILHGSVAKNTMHEESDIDMLLIEDENNKKQVSKMEKIFRKARSIPFYVDLEFLETAALKDDSYIRSRLEKLENPALYINYLWNGLVFDGNSFSEKSREDVFFMSCIEKMISMIQTFNPKKYRIRKEYK